MENNQIIQFQGRDILTLEKPELIEVIVWCAKELERENELHRSTLAMMVVLTK